MKYIVSKERECKKKGFEGESRPDFLRYLDSNSSNQKFTFLQSARIENINS